jgi:hypothetical protein
VEKYRQFTQNNQVKQTKSVTITVAYNKLPEEVGEGEKKKKNPPNF